MAHDIIPDDTCNKIRIHACYPKHKREQFKESYPEYMKALRNYLNQNTFKVPMEKVRIGMTDSTFFICREVEVRIRSE